MFDYSSVGYGAPSNDDLCCPYQEDVVEFNTRATVAGDIILALWYVKDHIVMGEQPLLAFAFHTSFMDPGIVKIKGPSLDLHKRARSTGDDQQLLLMELSLAETNIPVNDV